MSRSVGTSIQPPRHPRELRYSATPHRVTKPQSAAVAADEDIDAISHVALQSSPIDTLLYAECNAHV